MKLHVHQLALASAIAVVITSIITWIISYISLSIKIGQLAPLSFEMDTILALAISIGVSFIYTFVLVWIAAALYNKFAGHE